MIWTRSPSGIFFGVCQGLAESFKVEPWLLRFILLFAIFFLGSGLLIYLCLAISLPRNDHIMEAKEPKLLGVCYRISRHSNMELGLVRFLMLFLTLMSGGVIVFIYLVLHLLLKPVEDDIEV